tara:strand:- start:405 stop:614 length:210 start_codon:yes stop_codon:yes gene_type:complete
MNIPMFAKSLQSVKGIEFFVYCFEFSAEHIVSVRTLDDLLDLELANYFFTHGFAHLDVLQKIWFTLEEA